MPPKLCFTANCSFTRQSFSFGHYPPINQPPRRVYLLNTVFWTCSTFFHLFSVNFVSLQACKNGLVQHLEHLLFYGAAIDARTASGNTALHVAALNNQVLKFSIEILTTGPLKLHTWTVETLPWGGGGGVGLVEICPEMHRITKMTKLS